MHDLTKNSGSARENEEGGGGGGDALFKLALPPFSGGRKKKGFFSAGREAKSLERRSCLPADTVLRS